MPCDVCAAVNPIQSSPACHQSLCPAGLLAEIVRRPGDVENVLRLLLNQLRQVKVPSGKAEAEKELVMTAGKAHLDLLEQNRRLYLKSRALGSAQVWCLCTAGLLLAGRSNTSSGVFGWYVD